MTFSSLKSTDLDAAHAAATEAAKIAAEDCIRSDYGGQDMGACGFAWVTYYPKNKGNTRLGKLERKEIESIGFERDYTGKAWKISNPSKYPGQNVDAKMRGAQAYAATFEKMTGIKLYASDRLD